MTLTRRMVALAAVLAMGALLTPTTFASTPPADANTVRLHMLSGSDFFTYTNGDGSVMRTQTLAAKGCALKTSGDSIVSFQTAPASGSTVGLSSDQLGVRTSGEGSSGKCAQVNIPDQVLTMKIDHTGALGDQTFDFAELDIEAKYNATINIRLYYHGVQVDADLSTPEVDDYSATCTVSGSDCGPDSADHDNFRIRIPRGPTGTETVGFDELRLWATSTDSQGSVALEGGRDGTPAWPNGLGATIGTTDSVFHVADVLDCGDTRTAASDGLATVTVTRLANTDDPTGANCVAKNFSLTTAEETPPGGGGTTNVVTFDQEAITGQEGAHYLTTIIWTYHPDPDTSTSTNPSTIGGRTFYIDYGDGTGPHEAELCDSVTYDGQGNVTGATHPTGAAWCITGQSYTIDGDGNIVLLQSWDGLGDPKFW